MAPLCRGCVAGFSYNHPAIVRGTGIIPLMQSSRSNTMPRGLKLLAWQGVGLLVPAAWDLARREGDERSGSIRIDGHDRVRVQVLWQRDGGGRLHDAARRAAQLLKLPVPANQSDGLCTWLPDQGDPDACYVLEMSSEQVGESSVLVLARGHGRLIVLRFAVHDGWPDRGLLATMISSLSIEPVDQWRRWAIYDMAWSTPPSHTLSQASLNAGVALLEFRHGRRWWALRRFSAANAAMNSLEPDVERFQEWVKAVYSDQWYDMRYEMERSPGNSDCAELVLRARRRWFSPLEFRAILPRHRRSAAVIHVRWDRNANKVICFEFDRAGSDQTPESLRLRESYRVTMDQVAHSLSPPPAVSARTRALDALVRWRASVTASDLDGQRVLLSRPVPRSRVLRGLITLTGGRGGESVKNSAVELDVLGSVLWKRCRQPTPVRELIDEVAGRLQVVPMEAAASVTTFLQAMGSRGLVELVTESPAQADE
jgi:hypothetical protein